MRVIICGAGQVGYGIAEKLASEKNDVSVIDVAPDLIRNVRDTLDVRGFVGHGSHPGVLEAAGAAEADMIVAVTLHDEVNMVACQVAHSLFDVPTKIARIRSQSYLETLYSDLFSNDHMPIDVIISPELEVGDMVLKRIAMPGATDVVAFGDGRITMIAIECMEECPIVDTPLMQLTELFPDLNATVVGVSRAGKLTVPHSADQLQAGDLAYVVAARDHVRRTLGLFGHDETEATRIVVAGSRAEPATARSSPRTCRATPPSVMRSRSSGATPPIARGPASHADRARRAATRADPVSARLWSCGARAAQERRGLGEHRRRAGAGRLG